MFSFLLLACSASNEIPGTSPLDIELEVSEAIASVITVRWESEAEEPAQVDFGPDLALSATGTQLEDGSWEAVLVGLTPESEATVRVRHGDQEGTATVQTGEAPSWVPRDPELTGEGAPGFLATGFRSSEGRGAIVVDSEGRAVWWADVSPWGSDAYVSRVTLAPQQDAIWFNVIELRFAPEDADVSLGVVRVSLDGTEVEHIPLYEQHHDFWLHEDGRIAYLSLAEAEVEGTAVEIDALRRWSPDGTDEVLYSTEDVVTADTLEPWLNTIEYEAQTDRYWVGSKSMSAIFRIDAETGERVDLIGGPGSDWEVDEGTVDQHGFDLVDGGVLIFDNGDISEADSRPALYSLDEEAREASRVWDYGADPALYTNFMGDALQLPDGRVMGIWTWEGEVRQVDWDGEVLSTWRYGGLEMLTFGRFYEGISR